LPLLAGKIFTECDLFKKSIAIMIMIAGAMLIWEA